MAETTVDNTSALTPEQMAEIEKRDADRISEILTKVKTLESGGLADILTFQIIQGVQLFNRASSGESIDVSESIKFVSEVLGIDFVGNLKEYIKDKLVPDVLYSDKPLEDDFTDDDIVNYIVQNSQLSNESVDKYKQMLTDTITDNIEKI
jgi:uncharacterized protein YeeX (DUF496 family)